MGSYRAGWRRAEGVYLRVPAQAINTPRAVVQGHPVGGPWPLTVTGCAVVSLAQPLWLHGGTVVAMVLSEEDAAALALLGVDLDLWVIR